MKEKIKLGKKNQDPETCFFVLRVGQKKPTRRIGQQHDRGYEFEVVICYDIDSL